MFDVVVVQVINGYIGQVHAEIPGSAMVIVWQSIPFAPGDDVEDSCQGRQFAEIAANNAIAAAMSTMFVDIGTTSK